MVQALLFGKKHSSDRIRGMTRLYKVVFAANREAIFFFLMHVYFLYTGGVLRCNLLVTANILWGAGDNMGRYTTSGLYWDGTVS